MIVTIQAVSTERIEVYPMGMTSRPGYPSSGHGLILIFLARADTADQYLNRNPGSGFRSGASHHHCNNFLRTVRRRWIRRARRPPREPQRFGDIVARAEPLSRDGSSEVGCVQHRLVVVIRQGAQTRARRGVASGTIVGTPVRRTSVQASGPCMYSEIHFWKATCCRCPASVARRPS